MAWRCSARTNEGLVENLARAGIVNSKRVFEAMKKTDRAKYVGSSDSTMAYMDSPQPIGHMQTISAPHMHAYAMEMADAAIKNAPAPRILDVGSGSGYLTACFGRLVEASHGRVMGIEVIPELVEFAKKNIQQADPDLLEKNIVSIHVGDGWKGLPNEGPYNFIHVGAAAEVTPKALMDQLADGGRLIVPVGPVGGEQVLVEVCREKDHFKERKLMSVMYVPLVHQRTEL